METSGVDGIRPYYLFWIIRALGSTTSTRQGRGFMYIPMRETSRGLIAQDLFHSCDEDIYEEISGVRETKKTDTESSFKLTTWQGKGGERNGSFALNLSVLIKIWKSREITIEIWNISLR